MTSDRPTAAPVCRTISGTSRGSWSSTLRESGSRPWTLEHGSRSRLGTVTQTGAVIMLNGASSSGKSTLARHLQDCLDQPFLHVSSDQLVDGGALPRRRDETGPFAWSDHLRPMFFDGFHRCIPALASAGNNLVVDHIIEYYSWRLQLADLLAGFDVFLVGVHCDGHELARRERRRGDRRPGEGRAHVEENKIHQFVSYDFDVDTTAGIDHTHASRVAGAWVSRRRHRGLPPSA